MLLTQKIKKWHGNDILGGLCDTSQLISMLLALNWSYTDTALINSGYKINVIR